MLGPKIDFVKNAMSTEMKEKTERKIDVSTQESDVVQAVIFWAYHGFYSASCGNDPDVDGLLPATMHAKVYALAEEWQVAGLKEFAAFEFGRLAEKLDWNRDLLEAVSVIYTSTRETVRAMRDSVSELAGAKWKEWEGIDSFQQLLGSLPGFGADVARKLAAKLAASEELSSKKEPKVEDPAVCPTTTLPQSSCGCQLCRPEYTRCVMTGLPDSVCSCPRCQLGLS